MLLKFLLPLLTISSFSFADTIEKTIPELCQALDKAFQKRSWGKNPCSYGEWKIGGRSVLGRPLIYGIFGDPKAENTTLFFSMVHADEITPLYLGFEMSRWANQNLSKIPNTKMIIVPLVNPDGFFGYPKTRVNAHGVDCNRNFKTADWDRDALKAWRTKFKKSPRRFPGNHPNSEPETLFQRDMIAMFKPRKIISVHAPLNFLDYDGPDHLTLGQFTRDYVQKCVELKKTIKATSQGFFPGSLGNYAGQELGIPTITLELPTAEADKAKEYWSIFRKGLETVVKFVVP